MADRHTRWIDSISFRLTATLALTAVVVAGMVGTNVAIVSSQASAGLQINLAGRQRMLTQKMTKEFFADQQSAAPTGQWNASRELFEVTLAALRSGGTSYLDLGMTKSVALPAVTSPETQSQLRLVQSEWDALTEAMERAASSPRDSEAYATSIGVITAQNVAALKQMNSAVQMLQHGNEAATATMMTAQYVGGGIVGALMLVTFVIVRGRVLRPLERCSERMAAIAEGDGDLTARMNFHSRDEIGVLASSFDAFVARLDATIGDIRSGVNQIDSGADGVSEASQSLSHRAVEQAGSLQEMTSALQDVTDVTKSNADGANQAVGLSSESRSITEQGLVEMQAMVQAMDEIKSSSNEIASVIKVIDEIAFQTNLLALNAAVEAARAGEAGKGFAVVAEEVRSLAQRSAEAARQTGAMIERATSRAENGVSITGRVSEALESIATSISSVSSLIEQISTSTDAQSTSVGRINQTLMNVDDMTQQTASGSEELAAAAEETRAQTASILDVLRSFRAPRITRRRSRRRPGHRAVSATMTTSISMMTTRRSRRTIARQISGGPARPRSPRRQPDLP